jgi:hypothetical protein
MNKNILAPLIFHQPPPSPVINDRSLIITLNFFQKYLIPYQKLEQIMGSLILDFRAQNCGTFATFQIF